MPLIAIGTGRVYVNSKAETFQLFMSDSAGKHATSDDTTLRQALIQALNAPDSKKEPQGGDVFRMKINDGRGYLVYRLSVNGVPNSAAIFHYHWNYHLDLPLSAT